MIAGKFSYVLREHKDNQWEGLKNFIHIMKELYSEAAAFPL